MRLPTVITTEEELAYVQALVDELLDKHSLTPKEQEYLNELGNLIYSYESQDINLIPDIHGVALLKALLEDNHLESSSLCGVLGSGERVRELLEQEGTLTLEEIQALSSYFHVNPLCFYPRTHD